MDFGRAIKSAIDEQIHALNGVEAAAHLVGMGKSQLAAYRHPDREERVPLVVAMRLDEVAGNPVILTRAVGLLGYRLERIDDSAEGDITQALGATASASGKLISEGIQAGIDHVYTNAERRDLGRRIAELQAELTSLTIALGKGGEE